MKTQFTAAICVISLTVGVRAWALTPQGPGEHSTICTSDGSVRDDEFAKMIKDSIAASGKNPSSVKVFFNSCFGGGMLDDLVNTVGSTGVPVIAASASDSDQPAFGPDDAYAGATGSGSFWTNGLATGVANASAGQSVVGTIGAANAADPTAPGGAYVGSIAAGDEPEEPQIATANGGATINWAPGAEVVIFGGDCTNTRHGNNVSKMEDAAGSMWGSDPNSNLQSTDGSGSKADLQNMLTDACNNIDSGEELVVYVDDHGNTEFDVDEWWDWLYSQPLMVDPAGLLCTGPGGELPLLHEGWEQGLSSNAEQGDAVAPGLNLLADIDEPFLVDSFFDVFYDGMPLDLPDMLFPDEQAFIPIPYDPARFGMGGHLLEFVGNPLNPAPFPLELLNLELTSGPITETIVAVALYGDYNGNGMIDAADYTVWRDALATGSTELLNDATPGIVDEEDYVFWREHFGEVAMPMDLGADLATVPEPVSLCLAVLASLALVARRR